ncbi:ABC transporter permease [Clostridium sp.]|uniref:ABC transporter permease n=1 Tax=Clostridium sp. TaxID=1506 RepID=UPI001A5F6592|nr:ABC transporter permease [Clostridium sp.]MBK5239959.1 FtsX-like permease family protein [Clostridium sp.]
MITSYKKLTGKYLKRNKKRTILTIIGIMLSVALISTIGLFFNGIQDAQIQDARNKYGSAHVLFQKTDANLISKIVNNPKVSRSGLYTESDDVKLGDKLVVNKITATDKALELLPYNAKIGRLPESANEVAVEKWALSYIDKEAKVGNKIKVADSEYILVGILEDSIQSQIDGKGVILLKNNSIDEKNATLLVEISSKTNLKVALQELRQLPNSIVENDYLIQMQGAGEFDSGLKGLYVSLAIIIGIVLIATIAVIYNSFQISIVERIKQFGLLRAVGTTPKQIRKIVLREATILAIIAIPLGLICGIIAIFGIGIAFKLIGVDSVVPIKISISPIVLLISSAVGIVSIYLSALVPAYFASRISPLSAISGRNSITKEKIKRRKNVVIQRIFGFEGALAAKNIKRNRKRYRITVFSIVISVVLFVTFKSFMDMSLNISSDINESKDIHFSVEKDNRTSGLNHKTIDSKIEDDIKAMKSVDKVYRGYNPYIFSMAINSNSEVKEIQDMGNIYKKTTLDGVEETLMESCIVIYDKESIEVSKKYIESGNIDIEKLNSGNGVILYNKYRVQNQTTDKEYFGPLADIKVGDEIDLQFRGGWYEPNEVTTEFGKGNVQKVVVMAIFETSPFNNMQVNNNLNIITTEEMAKKLTGDNDIGPVKLNIVLKDIKTEDEGKMGIETAIKSSSDLRVINNIDSNRKSKSILLMIKILLYGFVLVVSLIGSVNIVNTLTTNIILRKREFATLKSIGLTQKGLRKMIILEGLLYGIVGAIYGSIIGCGISYLIGLSMGAFREFGWVFPVEAIAIAGVASIVIGYLSVLSPLSRIKKENLIEAVREDY